MLLLFLSASQTQAREIQILHTSDLHSHFEHAEDRDRGHYGAIKATLDRLRSEAAARGVDTLQFDSGDFSEGTPFFYAEEGALSWRSMDEMGYDAVALGNHDYLTGQEDMDRVIGETRPRFALVAANFTPDRNLRNLANKLTPSAEFVRAGLRITVVGATTDDRIYKWRAGRGAIGAVHPPVHAAVKAARATSDLVIALTHIGIDEDIKLAKTTRGLDLILGGHSHSTRSLPTFTKTRDKRSIPIVHSGKHGENIGQLILDVEPGRAPRFVSFQLVPVRVSAPHDWRMDQFVRSARARFEAQFKSNWLHEVIGYSPTPMTPPTHGDTTWGTLFGDAIRHASRADISVDAGNLFGDWQPGGPITREKLFAFYPRTFEFGAGIGWRIWLAECDGWIVQILIDQFRANGLYATVTGNGGQKLAPFRRYTIAVSESIGRAITEMMPGLDLIFLNPRSTGIPVLDAVEAELKRRGGGI